MGSEMCIRDSPKTVLPDGAHAVSEFENIKNRKIIGHVTSTYFSPTLDRSIALGLIEGGLDRIEDVIQFPIDDTRTIKARIVDPVFYDPKGSKLYA